MRRGLLSVVFVVLSACLPEVPKDCPDLPLSPQPDGEHEHSTLLQVIPAGRIPVVLGVGKTMSPVDNDELPSKEHSGPPGLFQKASGVFAIVTQPHHDEVLPLSTKVVYGVFLGLYAFAGENFSRRGRSYSNLHVHGFCTVAVSALAIGNVLVLFNVPFFLIVPWLYCGRFVAVTCWVAGFGHANGADRPEIVRAAILAAAAVGQLGASAVFAKSMKDAGVNQSIWPWMFFFMSCVGGLVAQQVVTSMSRNSLSWHEDKAQKKMDTMSQCVGYLGMCYAMLWVVTEGKPMLSKTAEALSFGIIDTLFIVSNSAILIRTVEQNFAADPKHEASSSAAEGPPQHVEAEISTKCASQACES